MKIMSENEGNPKKGRRCLKKKVFLACRELESVGTL